MMVNGLLSFQSRLDLYANEADPIFQPYDRFRTISDVVRLDFEPATTKGEQGSKIKYTQHLRGIRFFHWPLLVHKKLFIKLG